MNTFDKQNWAQVRSRGHTRFIVREGLLRWGVPFGLMVTLVLSFYNLVTHIPLPSVWRMVVSFTLLTVVFGYGMGEIGWQRGERAYHDSAA